jgi:formylglycine-generating enzyme required for sulfatase activity
MKKCTCSATNPDDANFCRICGKKFSDSVTGITEKPNRSFPEPAKIVRGIKFVLIKGGTFMMGSPESEPGRQANEKQHQVTVSDFYMSEKTITNEQYCVFLNEEKIDVHSNYVKSGYFAMYCMLEKNTGWRPKSGMENHPFVVTWNNATAYCRWLGVRLPSEAEWEYACRAGTDTPFNTGKNLTTSQANYNGNYPYDGNAPGINLNRLQPVGSYPPNAWGLYDMHGNVGEWCLDIYREYPTSPQTNPVETHRIFTDHVYRGGGFCFSAACCRSAVRRYWSFDSDTGYIGFRAVLPV